MAKKRYVEHNKLRQCVQCLKMFDAAHYDAMYCSNACKQRAKRWRAKAMDDALTAEFALRNLRQYMKTDMGEDLYPKLKLIKNICQDLMDTYDFVRPLKE